MYPYNRALKRSLQQRKRQQTDAETRSNMSSSTASDGIADNEVDIVWDPAEYKLTYVLENFRLPQIVRVVEGFMLTEDDCLASGTVLTIHGQQTIEQVCGIENNGLGRDISIPRTCPYKVKVTVPNHDKIFPTVKDLCNVSPLPKCVILRKKINFAGYNLAAGQCLIVNSISRNHLNEAFGLLVSKVENELHSFVLPLNIAGNFSPCPFPRDQSRCYFIRELSERPFPVFVYFVQSGERKALYGPQMGIVKLTKVVTSKVVFATSIIDGEKYAISFSRDLPVTIEVARGMLDNSATYVRKCKAEEAQIDLAVLSHLSESSPYSNEFNSSIYSDVKALQEAFMLRNDKYRSTHSSDSKSVSSDISFGEDLRSFTDPHYIMPYGVSETASTNEVSSFSRDSQGEETPSLSSVDNLSLASVDSANNTPSFEKPKSLVDSPRVTPIRITAEESLLVEEEYDSENDGYEKVVEWMDRPNGLHIKQTKTTDKGNPYSYPDCVFGSPRGALGAPPPIKPRATRTSSAPAPKAAPRPSTSNQKPSANSDLGTVLPQSSADYVAEMVHFLKHEQMADYIPETLGRNNLDTASDRSDQMSIASEYMSVKSEQNSDCFSEDEHPYVEIVNPDTNEDHDDSENKQGDKIVNESGVDIKAQPTPVPRRMKSIKNDVEIDGFVVRDEAIGSYPLQDLTNESCTSLEDINAKTCSSEIQVQSLNATQQQGDTNFQSSDAELDDSEHQYINKQDTSRGSNNEDGKASAYDEIRQETEEGVCMILEKLKLSQFVTIFQDNQINGELLIEISADEFVSDLGLSIFHAKKVLLYLQGWRPFEDGITVADNVQLWSVDDVYSKMVSINLKSFAQFCAENQVDGILLKEILQEEILQCLRDIHGVKLSSFEEKKLRRFVKDGWRPDSSMKR